MVMSTLYVSHLLTKIRILTSVGVLRRNTELTPSPTTPSSSEPLTAADQNPPRWYPGPLGGGGRGRAMGDKAIKPALIKQLGLIDSDSRLE